MRTGPMQLLISTNDMVLLSYALSLLGEDGVATLVLDQHISLVEGSIGAFPRRLMVSADDNRRARRLLREAGLGEYLVGDADD